MYPINARILFVVGLGLLLGSLNAGALITTNLVFQDTFTQAAQSISPDTALNSSWQPSLNAGMGGYWDIGTGAAPAGRVHARSNAGGPWGGAQAVKTNLLNLTAIERYIVKADFYDPYIGPYAATPSAVTVLMANWNGFQSGLSWGTASGLALVINANPLNGYSALDVPSHTLSLLSLSNGVSTAVWTQNLTSPFLDNFSTGGNLESGYTFSLERQYNQIRVTGVPLVSGPTFDSGLVNVDQSVLDSPYAGLAQGYMFFASGQAGLNIDNFTALSVIPEPSAAVLLLVVGGIALSRRRHGRMTVRTYNES